MLVESSSRLGDAPASVGGARLTSLPVPHVLDKSLRELQRRRIKDLESKLREHKRTNCLGEDELQLLMEEFEQLHSELSIEGDDPSSDKRGVMQRRLELKKEIKEVERQIKQFRKQNSSDQKQLLACMNKLDYLKHELLQIQRQVVFSLRLCERSAEENPQGITLAFGDKVSLVGLSDTEATSLWNWFSVQSDAKAGVNSTCGSWNLWVHSNVQVAAICSPDLQTLSAELQQVATLSPHVICARMACLRARGGICSVLRDFKGGLLLIEGPRQIDNELETACLLHAVGIKERWSAQMELAVLAQVEVPSPLKGEVLADIRLRDIKEDAMLTSLLEQVEDLYPQEFDDDLLELLGTEGVRLGLLVPVGSSHKQDAAEQPPMLGFIIYKFWGPPLKSMSISRVAVPKKYQMHGFGRLLVRWAIEKAKQKPRHECTSVSLLATAKAIPFYEHLNFRRMPEPEDDPHSSEGCVWFEYQFGRIVRQ